MKKKANVEHVAESKSTIFRIWRHFSAARQEHSSQLLCELAMWQSIKCKSWQRREVPTSMYIMCACVYGSMEVRSAFVQITKSQRFAPKLPTAIENNNKRLAVIVKIR